VLARITATKAVRSSRLYAYRVPYEIVMKLLAIRFGCFDIADFKALFAQLTTAEIRFFNLLCIFVYWIGMRKNSFFVFAGVPNIWHVFIWSASINDEIFIF
jgi:hypothetical protein